MTDAIVCGPGEGTPYSPRGHTIVFKAVGAQTDGAFSMMERTVPPRGRQTPSHRHPGAELFFVLAGDLRFTIDGRTIDGGAGSSVLVPKGVAHTFGNVSDEDARVLIIHSPAADDYFAELNEMWSRPEPPTVETERELQRRHGWEPG